MSYAPKKSGGNELSRRAMIAAGAALLAETVSAERVSAQSKTSPSAAGYQNRPNNGQACGACAHFLAPSSCELVEGPISPQGWCRFFTSR